MEDNIEDKSKQDVMVSNLPLLFSDGNPTSINSMSAEDFQYFIPFLLKCILGCEPSGWVKHAKFKWWPSDVPWSPIILTKKHQTQNWRNKLQKLVKNCYEYNGCTYLLHFSAKLQTLSGGYRFDDNWDGTTSMYDSTSGKLLVTFQNENMNYDKGFRQQSSTSRPMLLPRLNSPNSPAKMNIGSSNNPSLAIEAPTAAKMVEPPANDIYLCDYCGADFSSLTAIKAHEAKCMADKALEAHSNNTTFTELETEDMDGAKFLWYLSLSGRNQTVPPANVTPAKVRPVVRRACTLSDKRFTTIPFSSNLGQSFFKATKLTMAASENLVNRYDRLCPAKPISSSITGEHVSHPNPPGPASYRFRPVFLKRKEEWTHSYSFNRADRMERMQTIKTGLNKRGRQLLHQCQDVRVRMKKLKPDEIEMWTKPKPKKSQPLLQPWLQRSIANLPPSCTISLAPMESSQTWLRHHQASSPSLTVSRPEMSQHTMTAKQQHTSSKHQARSPPGLLPLITNAWSMQTMQSVKPKPINNQYILPDLIPVINRNSKTRPPDPVIIQMPALPSPRSAASSSSYQVPPRESISDIIDLCSSEDEADVQKGSINSGTHSKSLVIPPGISITKVQTSPNGVNCQTPSRPHVKPSERPRVKGTEDNNNRSRCVSQWLESSLGSLPVLQFMGQHPLTIKKEPVRNAVALATPTDASLPIVTPLKLGKLPAEKREQMKQSLLKIQQKEGKSPSSADKGSPSKATHCDSDLVDPLLLSPSSQTALSPSKDLSRLLGDECKELKHKGLSDLLVSSQRLTRRKRAKEPEFYSCDEEDYLSDGPSKKTKLDQSPSSTSPGSRTNFNENYSTVIEVDVGGPDTETQDSSRASSFGSLTPDSKRPRKRNELSKLLKDECKELRRKGLEDLTFEADSNQRITRCRTKSLPIVANRR